MKVKEVESDSENYFVTRVWMKDAQNTKSFIPID